MTLISFTTKITKDTKVAEILFLNFVLFVSFVVITLSRSTRKNQALRDQYDPA